MKLIKESWNFGGFGDDGNGMYEFISPTIWFRIIGLKEGNDQSSADPKRMGWPCHNYKKEKITKEEALSFINQSDYDDFYKLYKLKSK